MTTEYIAVGGGCFCGAVRYEAEVNLYEAFYCHCKICQKISGTPAVIGVFVKPGTLRFTHNEPKYFQSSPFGSRGFCANCGSGLIWMTAGEAEGTIIEDEWTNVSVCSLDHPESAIPTVHTCVESQLPWYQLADDLPRTRSEDDPELVAAWTQAGLSNDGTPL